MYARTVALRGRGALPETLSQALPVHWKAMLPSNAMTFCAAS